MQRRDISVFVFVSFWLTRKHKKKKSLTQKCDMPCILHQPPLQVQCEVYAKQHKFLLTDSLTKINISKIRQVKH